MFEFKSYFVFMGIGWGISFVLFRSIINQINIKKPYLTFFGAILFSWVGSKIFFLLFSDYEGSFLTHILNSRFWLESGFVFYGGLFFGSIFYLFAQRRDSLKFFYFLPCLTLGHGVGRIGCFFVGCCYGIQCDLPWAVNVNGLLLHPVQLYESIFLISLTPVLYFLNNRFRSYKLSTGAYFIFYGTFRFFNEFLRGDLIRGVFRGLSTSQYISLFLIFLGTLFLFMLFKKRIQGQ